MSRLPILLIAAALSISAAQVPATARAPAHASPSAKASKVSESNKLYEFDYSYPAEAARIPALKRWLDADRAKARAQLIADTKATKAEETKDFEYRAYGLGREWLKVAETPRFLSLSEQIYEYTGGAHPNHGYDSLLWDKQAGRRIAPLALFTSAKALDAAIRQPFCDAVDKERAKRRGEPVKRNSGAMFDDCIKPSEQTVIVGSSNGRTFDKVGVLVGPYAAGSYAEGDYEFTLPVTAALMKAVKPEYREAFSVR